jgi:hypothetical protein
MVKRITKNVSTLNISNSSEIEKVVAFVREQGILEIGKTQ